MVIVKSVAVKSGKAIRFEKVKRPMGRSVVLEVLD